MRWAVLRAWCWRQAQILVWVPVWLWVAGWAGCLAQLLGSTRRGGPGPCRWAFCRRLLLLAAVLRSLGRWLPQRLKQQVRAVALAPFRWQCACGVGWALQGRLTAQARVAPTGFAGAPRERGQRFEAASPMRRSGSAARPGAAPAPQPPASRGHGAKGALPRAVRWSKGRVQAPQAWPFSVGASPNRLTVAAQTGAGAGRWARSMRCRAWRMSPATPHPKPGARPHQTRVRKNRKCRATAR